MVNKRLLIVEDNKLFRESMIFALQKYFKVDACGNYYAALEFIQKNRYDLIITDGAFPQSGDFEVYNPKDEDYRGNLIAPIAKKLGIQIIGVSSEPRRLIGFKYVFQKPVDVLELINFIQKELKI